MRRFVMIRSVSTFFILLMSFTLCFAEANEENRGWLREVHAPKPHPDGIVWLDNLSDGTAFRGSSDNGVGIEAVSSSGFALKSEGTSYFNGSVGIGILQPEYKLDIFGGLRTSDVTRVSHLYYSADFPTIEVGDYQYGLSSSEGSPHLWNAGGGFAFKDYYSGQSTVRIKEGKMGIGTSEPQYKLDVEGDVQAHAYHTGDIYFYKDAKKLWRMFEDEQGLYLEKIATGEVSRIFLEKDIENLKSEIKKELLEELK